MKKWYLFYSEKLYQLGKELGEQKLYQLGREIVETTTEGLAFPTADCFYSARK